MAGREQRFKDPEEAVLIEQSRLLIAEMERLIERAKLLTREHKAIRETIRERRRQYRK